MATANKRTAPVKVLLSAEIDQQLRQLGDRLGQSPATLASIAVSQWVAQQTASLGVADRAATGFFESLAAQLGPDFKKLLSGLPDEQQGAPLAGGQPVPAHVPGPQGAASEPYSLIHGNKSGKTGEGEGRRRRVDGPTGQLRIEEAGHGKSNRKPA